MQLKNQQSSYGWISIAFHWVIAISVLSMFALGLWMVELDYYSNWYHDAPNIHKSVGVLLILAMLLRFFWNVFNPKPKALGDSAILRAVSSTVHLLFYLLVLLIGMSGYLISTAESQAISVFNWFDVPAWFEPFEHQADIAGEIHELLAFTLIGFVALHALAALKHHFIDKDNTLKRMLKPSLNDLEN
ncbi:cytochrome b [Thiomicrorhabdus lithotrophica]|uniref:Cytochrome b n=1 Tax=Thiomicrorhabdus lithotrophica TaxID=2949997 RepID=A0ABY8C9M0_9GAMM|nr:cytochrome b [Thiomicrorhabdus lithotrophica]WEJ61937.1 cytochrome b [Thiomicrorhabdus lithotrophica]